MAIDALESAEDYLERILMLQKESDKEIRAIDLARSFGYSKASISVALRKLEEKGYVELGPKSQLILTESGKSIAEKVFDRHETIGAFFMSIGVDEDTAYKDACRIEHILSEDTFEALKKFAQEKTK